jgi:hypothetical protein
MAAVAGRWTNGPGPSPRRKLIVVGGPSDRTAIADAALSSRRRNPHRRRGLVMDRTAGRRKSTSRKTRPPGDRYRAGTYTDNSAPPVTGRPTSLDVELPTSGHATSATHARRPVPEAIPETACRFPVTKTASGTLASWTWVTADPDYPCSTVPQNPAKWCQRSLRVTCEFHCDSRPQAPGTFAQRVSKSPQIVDGFCDSQSWPRRPTVTRVS